MKKWKLWTGLIIIFLAGICIGAVGTGIFVRHTIFSLIQGGRPAVAKLVTKRLASRLDLSESQQAEVFKTVRKTQLRLLELRRRHQPETEEIISSGIAQIKTELSQKQQEKMDELYNRFLERWNMIRNCSDQNP